MSGGDWTLKAHAPQRRALDLSNDAFAAMMGLTAGDIRETPLWVNTGNEQLVAPLASADAVRLCRPDTARMGALTNAFGVPKIYMWADLGGGEVLARFFGLKHGAIAEDHGTGSAAANLGGWYVTHKATLPLKCVIRQGEPISRPSRLLLEVDANGGIYVGGRVIELGMGSVVL